MNPFLQIARHAAFSFLIVVPSLLGSTAWSQDLDKGLRYYSAKNYAAALKELRPLAENGDPTAQFTLGTMYSYGRGVVQNYRESAKWLRNAANQGQANAQYGLAYLYHEGHGVQQDYAVAANWAEKSATQGNSKAAVLLGYLYSLGKGVPINFVTAHMWWGIADVLGDRNDNKSKSEKEVLERAMSDEQVSEAGKLAREWLADFEARDLKR